MTGTARLHGAPPAVMLARLVRRMKTELGLTGSIGLSHNKFLAKVASDLDKPHGFSVIGRAETMDFLRDKPVRMIWGVGAAAQARSTRRASAPFPTCCAGSRPISWHASAAWANGCGTSHAARTAAGSRAHAPMKIHLQRDHLRRGHLRPRPAGRPHLAHGRKSRGPRQGQGARGPRGHTQAQARQSYAVVAPGRAAVIRHSWRIASTAPRGAFSIRLEGKGPYRLLGVWPV